MKGKLTKVEAINGEESPSPMAGRIGKQVEWVYPIPLCSCSLFICGGIKTITSGIESFYRGKDELKIRTHNTIYTVKLEGWGEDE